MLNKVDHTDKEKLKTEAWGDTGRFGLNLKTVLFCFFWGGGEVVGEEGLQICSDHEKIGKKSRCSTLLLYVWSI